MRKLRHVIKDRIDTWVSEEHDSKAYFPISDTDEGISICSNDEHSEKAQSPIIVTDEGIFISFIDLHPQKA